MQLSSKLPHLETTIFTVMSALSKKHNALNLSQGFPNFKSDPKLIELVTKAMKSGQNQYAPMMGAPSLREAIVEKIEKCYGYSYHPDNEIMVTVGASQAIFSAICAFIHKGDEAIIFRPAYDCYEPAIQLNGGIVKDIQLEAPYFKINWSEVKQLISEKTKLIIVNTPNNPSGTILEKEDMVKLKHLTEGTNIVVISDEVYEHMVYDGEQHCSASMIAGLRDRTIVTASFGKTFHNTGWKTGYCVAPQVLMDEIVKVHMFSVFSVNHPVQLALAEYLQHEDHYLGLAAFYQKKRDLFLALIKESRFKFIPSKGTYFQLLDFSEITTENDVVFAKRLTIENKLASIPTSVFNKDQKDFKQLRFCFAKTDETLEQAAEIIRAI